MDQFYKVPVEKLSQGAEFLRPHFFVIVGNHVTKEDLLRPVAWIHHARKLQGRDGRARFALIEVLTEDGLLEMHLRVVAIRDGLVLVRPIYIYEDPARVVEAPVEQQLALTGNGEPVPEGYKVGHAPKTGFWVKLEATSEMIFKGLPNWGAARDKAVMHAKMAGTYKAPIAKAPAEAA